MKSADAKGLIPTAAVMNVRDSLLAALTSLPGTREFHLHVLNTPPRKNSTLYPCAIPRAKIYVQDILVLLSEQSTLDSPRVLVSAIEACLHHAPLTSCMSQKSTPPAKARR